MEGQVDGQVVVFQEPKFGCVIFGGYGFLFYSHIRVDVV